MTGDNVTECVGGARGLDEEGLAKAYRSGVDPRLNYEQALEMALLIARKMAALPLQWKKPPPHDLPRSD
jgi:3-deoxy-7-phosphoheptulonate synthase